MKNALTLLGILLLALSLSCAGLEYPDYWTFDHGIVRNVVTLPFELLFTPVIFVLKLLPIL